MLVIGIETSGASGGVALVRGDEVLAEETLARGLRHGRNLIPALERCLASAGVGPSDLDAVSVNRGPGSHTGIRIGVMAAQTLSHQIDRPLTGIPALEALCVQVPPGAPAIVAAIHARRDQLFAAVRSGTDWLLAPGLRTADELLTAAPRAAVLIGTGVELLRPLLASRGDLVAAPPADAEIRAASVARLAARHPEHGAPPEAIRPIYFP